MFFTHVLKQLKRRSELLVKLAKGIPSDWKPTASLRTIRRKGRNNNMAAGFYRLHDLLQARSTISHIGQKVKNGAVMPDVIHPLWQLHRANIASNPSNAVTRRPKSFANNC